MVIEATQVTGLGQDGQCVDRPDAGDLAQQLIINVVGEPDMSKAFDLIALLDETASLRNDHTEHGDRRRVLWHW